MVSFSGTLTQSPKERIEELISEIGKRLREKEASPTRLIQADESWKEAIQALTNLLAWVRNQRKKVGIEELESLQNWWNQKKGEEDQIIVDKIGEIIKILKEIVAKEDEDE